MKILIGICVALAIAVVFLFWRNDVNATEAARLQGELTSAVAVTKTFQTSIDEIASRFDRVTAQKQEIALALQQANSDNQKLTEQSDLAFEKMLEAEEAAAKAKGKVYVKNVCDLRGVN